MEAVEGLAPMDVSEDSDTSDTGDSAAPSVFIQHGFQNEANFSQPIQGQITQVGRENTVNICTETQTFRFKITSKHKDVEAVVAINMVLSDEDLDPTKTLFLGQDSNQGKITAGEEIIIRIESDKQANRPRNGYTMGGGIRSVTSSILTSLFERVEMIVNYFRHGSIIIGLQPKTDRAVFTLINAMEEGFIEELVRGILENEPDWNTDDNSDEPIKMKIDINIPKGMFPKDFPCRKFASRKELLEELSVSMQSKGQEELDNELSVLMRGETYQSEMTEKTLLRRLRQIGDELPTETDTVEDDQRKIRLMRAAGVAMAAAMGGIASGPIGAVVGGVAGAVVSAFHHWFS